MSKEATDGGGDKFCKSDRLNAALFEAFKRFCTKKNQIRCREVFKWCKDAKVIGKYMDAAHIDVSFFKVKRRNTNCIDFKEMLHLIDELVTKYVDDTWIPASEALGHLKYKLSIAKPTLHCTLPDVTIGAVDRLTDQKAFTGVQKKKFDDLKKSKSRYDGWLKRDVCEGCKPTVVDRCSSFCGFRGRS